MMATAVQTAARTTLDGYLRTACHPDWADDRGQRVSFSERLGETA